FGEEGLEGKTIAILGLTFKPNTDDMREAPSIDIIEALQAGGAKVRAFDPVGIEQARALLKDVGYGANPYEIAEGADALVLVTEWEAFRSLDFARLRETMRRPLLVDLRNVYDGPEVARQGFGYICVGRPHHTHLTGGAI